MIPIYKPMIEEDDIKAICETAKTGWVSSRGENIQKFENQFSNYIGMKRGVATSNGTTALHLALSALGIHEGDEVIVPDFTFVSPVNAVLYQGATPVLVDAENETWGMDSKKILSKITPKTKAIIAVHIYGNPARIDEIKEIAQEQSLYLIEDCAESIGATFQGKRVGTFGVISCFSFYGNKIITTGEGGMCLTNDKDLEARMKMFRDHGMSPARRYWHEVIGYNYRMTNIQAALGLSQLSKIDRILARKKYIARIYYKNLPEKVATYVENGFSESVFWLFCILSRNENEKQLILGALERNGYETRSFFYPVHSMPPYSRFVSNSKSFSVSEHLSDVGLNLPSYPELTENEILEVCDTVKSAVK
jgi:perosamine synthetase